MNSHQYVVYIYSSKSSQQQHEPLPHLDWKKLNNIAKAAQNINKNCIQMVTPNVPILSMCVRCLIFERT